MPIPFPRLFDINLENPIMETITIVLIVTKPCIKGLLHINFFTKIYARAPDPYQLPTYHIVKEGLS